MKTILTYSGGLDSTVLLWHLRSIGDEVRCLSIDYGQRHRRELEAAGTLCVIADVEHKIIDLRCILPLLEGSSQTRENISVPEGHYEEESMKLTVVPNRNAILLSLGVAWAISTKSDRVTYAAHAGDRSVYPDCREEFIVPFAEAMRNADWHRVEVDRPFLFLTKDKITKMGKDLGVPFEKTWSCYKGEKIHCGRCGTCCERAWAFSSAGIDDPTVYKDKDFWKTVIS